MQPREIVELILQGNAVPFEEAPIEKLEHISHLLSIQKNDFDFTIKTLTLKYKQEIDSFNADSILSKELELEISRDSEQVDLLLGKDNIDSLVDELAQVESEILETKNSILLLDFINSVNSNLQVFDQMISQEDYLKAYEMCLDLSTMLKSTLFQIPSTLSSRVKDCQDTLDSLFIHILSTKMFIDDDYIIQISRESTSLTSVLETVANSTLCEKYLEPFSFRLLQLIQDLSKNSSIVRINSIGTLDILFNENVSWKLDSIDVLFSNIILILDFVYSNIPSVIQTRIIKIIGDLIYQSVCDAVLQVLNFLIPYEAKDLHLINPINSLISEFESKISSLLLSSSRSLTAYTSNIQENFLVQKRIKVFQRIRDLITMENYDTVLINDEIDNCIF